MMPTSTRIACFFLCVTLASLGGGSHALAADAGKPVVVEAINDVTHQKHQEDDWQESQAGQSLKPLDKVRTGNDSRAEVDVDPGLVRLYQNAILVVPEVPSASGAPQQVQLRGGAGIFQVPKTAGVNSFSLRTNQIILGVKGTTFSVITEGKELYQQEITSAIRSFTSMDLTGAVVVERWVDPADGTVYSLVRLDRGLLEEHLSRLKLSRPAGLYVRKAFSSSAFRLETEEGRKKE